ncbi:hypothetical protein GOARA_065_00020 [Gordonia araii NBRC 100433]|uniref:Nitroreductase n=1 Tax=Gordonia araii NBRC 100433 TaxID=1073574 RepID=G7H5T4_9ACTN|nr:nitroreductase/quinone reductase family protein [Gordonia araii]NNG95715.1 nitroreductase family deazaflavin-dependent oxidoreductase [Gordonia araii NBRC 100433]GAB11209.1 hypothetical protein GOARA_065_00020 [Gordonia araii NBRC 100433]
MRPIRDYGAKAMNVAHRVVLTVSGNRILSKPYGMPVVELHTVGRKSGLERSCYLTTPVHDESRVILVASKGGDDRHPDWYRNLETTPEAEITLDGVRRPVRARTASPDEKATLWPQIVSAYRGYESYQKRTDRDIPVVICDLV